MFRPFLSLCSFVCFSLSCASFAAQTVSVTYRDLQPQLSHQKLNSFVNPAVLSVIDNKTLSKGLSRDYRFKPVGKTRHQNGITHTRYQQYYQNMPVWGRQIAVHGNKDGLLDRVNGKLSADINLNIKQLIGGAKGEKQALNLVIARAIAKAGFKRSQVTVDNGFIKLYVYIDRFKQAYLAYHVGFKFFSEDGAIDMPNIMVEASSLQVLDQWSDLQHYDATGPGGNEKTGQYEFGAEGKPSLEVTESDGTCTMENANVKTIDLNHNTSGDVHSFTCARNTHKAINGAYSPINDAHVFGGVVFDMYNQWYNTAPLTFQLVMNVHYGTDYDNAFWDGASMTFGDGYEVFYPLVGLDVVSHEVAHGFTSQHSDLIYSGQSGGINEAFSDIAGDAAEYFLNGSNDWLIGADITKTLTALRYFEDPTLDGRSIGHADDYQSGMNVHYSSGVFNRAFYLIAHTNGWDVRKAFDIFVGANQNYWTNSTDFVEGACGVINAAVDLGYSIVDVYSAFNTVGVTCNNMPIEDADADGMPDYWEQEFGFDLNDAADANLDADVDGLTNLSEFIHQTNPLVSDTDSDALSDGLEVNTHNTSPINSDSDNDELLDGLEVLTIGSDPLKVDTDNDGMPDGWEYSYGLNLLLDDAGDDADGDSVININEYLSGTSPNTVDLQDIEPNNSIEQAQDIDGFYTLEANPSIGDTATVIPHITIVGRGDNSYDYYHFTIDSDNKHVIFDIDQTDNLDSYLRLYNASGELLFFNDDSSTDSGGTGSINRLDSYLDISIAQAGEYYLKVSQFADAIVRDGATYVLHVSIESSRSDSDGDGMPDVWEQAHGLNSDDATDGLLDNDDDELTNLQEYINDTNPNLADTDGDGLEDGAEVNFHHTNPLLADTDGDGVSDSVDAFPLDAQESVDTDGDGMGNNADTDDDNDLMLDTFEIQYGLDPLDASDSQTDLDGDGLSNYLEFVYGSSPIDNTDAQNDYDGDGFGNLEEMMAGTDAMDSRSFPVYGQGWILLLLEQSASRAVQSLDKTSEFDAKLKATSKAKLSVLPPY